MDPIVVSAPPQSALNKNRGVSDLVKLQVQHFQHVEQKLGLNLNLAYSADVHTEGGAARYIGLVTRAIRSRAGMGIAIVPPTRRSSDQGLSLAASAETTESKISTTPTTPPRKSKKRKKP